MGDNRNSVVVLRAMLVGLVVVYSIAIYCQWHPFGLSSEATTYRQLVWLSGSGFSLLYVAQKVCWVLGNGAGLLGVILMFIRRQSGVTLVGLSLPILYAAMMLGSPPSAYPDIESAIGLLLWCTTSAIWGCVIVYALLQRRVLFL